MSVMAITTRCPVIAQAAANVSEKISLSLHCRSVSTNRFEHVFVRFAFHGFPTNQFFHRVLTHFRQTLAPIPHATMWPFSAVYMGKLYCIGGRATPSGIEMHSVQIYQP
jgi:hypothetical protein